MTRKDFELIARTIKALTEGENDQLGQVQKRFTAWRFAEALREHSGNSSFDGERFLKACGVK